MQRDRSSILAACLLGLAVIAALSGRDWYDGLLLDTDSYMRLAFLEQGLSAGRLQDYLFARDGAPGGMQVHWTLPFNFAVIALAAPLAPWLGWHGALSASAPLVGPLTFLGMAAALFALSRALGLRHAAPWAIAIAAMAPAILSYSKLGRVDHHIVSVMLGTMAMATALRLCRSLRPRDGVLAAGWAVLACWQSMETVPAVAAAWGVVIVAAALRRRASHGFSAYGRGLAYGALAVLLADPAPEGLFHFASDRFSAFHASLLMAMAIAVPVAIRCRGRGGPWRRSLWAMSYAIMTLAVWALLAALLTPSLITTPAFDAYFWSQVAELKPVWSEAKMTVFALLPAAPALAILARGLWLRRHRPCALAWLAALLILSAETVAGALHLRMAYYPAVLGSVVLGAALYRWAMRWSRDSSGSKARAMFLAFALTGAVTAGIQAARPFISPGRVESCTIGAEAARRIADALPDGTIVAADLWVSPELLWRTGLRTIAGPYHRNVQGISDLGRVFMSADDREIQEILERRGAGAVLACQLPRYLERPIFAKDSLQQRLATGRLPDWLEAIDIAHDNIRLYRLISR